MIFFNYQNAGGKSLLVNNFLKYTFQVEDENDNQPMPDAPEYRFHVSEGASAHTIIATVTGKDSDVTGNQIHHAIATGDHGGYFIINPSTG